MAEQKAVEDLSYEEAIAELEAIVAKLQGGDIPLKESMDQFERGVALANHCNHLLGDAEDTMTKLMNENDELEEFEKPEE